MKAEPFKIAIPDHDLHDLMHRLSHSRFPDDFANDGWTYGMNSDYLRELLVYWLREYDWRRQEQAMNAYPHFRTVIDGAPIHFMHIRGKGKNPMPLIMNHGWPWTFWDFYKVIGPLTDPAAHGGDAADSFDIVIPSLPGYGFSSPLRVPGISAWRTADLWVKLMQDVLGYKRFGTQGGDWGAFVSAQLGHKYADRVIGVHLHFPAPIGNQFPAPEDFTPEEEPWIKRNQGFMQGEAGYSAIQMSKPQTIAHGLNDSPMGLCAWLVEKRRTWSDCHGDVESVFTKDELLNNVTLYWLTQTYGTSARYYYEYAHNPWTPSHSGTPTVQAPTAFALFPGEIFFAPRKWAERHYNLKRWTHMPAGGHFAPMEQPEHLVKDIRAFFRDLRG